MGKINHQTVLQAERKGTEKLCVPLADVEKYKAAYWQNSMRL
jgi:hypothetical protein